MSKGLRKCMIAMSHKIESIDKEELTKRKEPSRNFCFENIIGKMKNILEELKNKYGLKEESQRTQNRSLEIIPSNKQQAKNKNENEN